MGADKEPRTSVAAVDPLTGTIFDQRFRIEERIAAGGFGAIYRASHVKSGHPVALKVLLPSLAQDLGVVARFRREGDALTALRCPHTISAYELGQAADRTLFIIMELLHGETLFERYQAHGPFEWKRMVRIARQVCESLAEAHELGIVHRDLKPTNIHLENQDGDPDYVKVLDFGIAKIIRGSEGFDASDITNAGTMIGTLDYMSPEQMVGGAVTGQTDIYTLGIVMYEMIAGTRPFPEAQSALSALAAMMKTTPEPLYLRAPVPEEISRIVMRCLERDMARRYPNVGELMADLDNAAGASISNVDRTKTVELDGLAKLAAARRANDEDDATTITPPPERILEALRTPKVELRPVSEWGEAATVAAAVRSDIAADHAQHADDDEADEYAPTSTRRPEGAEALRRGAPSRRAASDDEGPTTFRRDGDELDAKTPRSPRRDHGDRTPTNPRDASDAKTPTVRRETSTDARGGGFDPDSQSRGNSATRPPPDVDPAARGRSAIRSDVDPAAARGRSVSRPDVEARVKSATRPPPTPDPDARHKPPTQPPPNLDAPGKPAPFPVTPHPAARPLASRHIATPVPQVVVAPFSSTSRPAGIPTPTPGSVPPGVPLPTPPGMAAVSPPTLLGPPAPGSSPYGTAPGPFGPPGASPFGPPGSPSPYAPAGSLPGRAPVPTPPGANPFAGQGPGSNPFAQTPGSNPFAQTPGSNPIGAPLQQHPYGIPQTPYGIPQTPQPRVQYDMGTLAAREAVLRRWVWIIALIVATGIGFLIWIKF